MSQSHPSAAAGGPTAAGAPTAASGPTAAGGATATGMAAPSAAGLDPRRKRALWRAWHRGTREMDLIMGRFADREIGTVTEEELVGFEALLERQESEVYSWVTGEVQPPDGIEGLLVERMKAFPGTN